MNTKFKELGLSEPILKALSEMSFIEPTPVQQKAIPKILNAKDLIVMSKTGSGKTGAFGLPMIEQIQRDKSRLPKGLVLSPTRELAIQVASDLKKMAKYKDVRITVVYGQHSMAQEIEALKKGAQIVVGTPGRLNDHIRQGNLKLHQVKYLVLDEADRMLDMGFIDQVEQIVRKTPKERVTLLFSATMPTAIEKLSERYMKDSERIEFESDSLTVDSIEQSYYRVEAAEKRRRLHFLLEHIKPDSCIVFCNTRMTVEMVHAYLERKGYQVKALHGANSQSHRLRAIDQFKKDQFQILCATDIAARGLHVEDLSLVVNFDVPLEKDSYVHRIGRTGRAGNGGRAISLVSKDEIRSLYEIEEHVGVLIEEADFEDLVSHEDPIKVESNVEEEPSRPAEQKKRSIIGGVLKWIKRN
ncbi:DEAD/DEAH box helicase [Fusibacter tunisiensis]|uniref:Superfamily II DNA/RNA helicase n=1 Tax=Fusibacter tunisiensis TaxID=1008308 RepID=A0ABS2MQP7_9FIRM|nr:DEAD/DEAH box helicase [Fusibacter tunisiensis]MBM7561718.1 superfamily II DNA/RNA helicase [Fusibacter tunisiensis]